LIRARIERGGEGGEEVPFAVLRDSLGYEVLVTSIYKPQESQNGCPVLSFAIGSSQGLCTGSDGLEIL